MHFFVLFLIYQYQNLLWICINRQISILLDIHNIDNKNHNIFHSNIQLLSRPFAHTKEGRFFSGNTILLYFSTNLIANPLDVLFSVTQNLKLKNKYFAVDFDYLIYKDEIIYYIMFRYSLSLEPNLSEILDLKQSIIQSTFKIMPDSALPNHHKNFQKELLHEFDRTECIESALTFKHHSVFSPF